MALFETKMCIVWFYLYAFNEWWCPGSGGGGGARDTPVGVCTTYVMCVDRFVWHTTEVIHLSTVGIQLEHH